MITIKNVTVLSRGFEPMDVCDMDTAKLIGKDFSSLFHVRQEGHRLLPDALKGNAIKYVILFADGTSREFIF